ncbi:ubiquitin carboxyl-terminal hydrolase 47-like [Uloborus diversus]|uniref:ubiquitin carboxyl-terminal hydrolase 47-like n=1 Tax=Uloborus diversus TaxID=327109 RepID=UPI00240A034A|nr:ubiquitin carboxyl-terminal hydrolase 47-like [Uloborus diversus]
MVPGENTQIVAIQGMCATATAAADEPRALCIIRDLSTSVWDDGGKSAINLPASTTGAQLVQEVSKKFGYHPDTFELILQRKSDKATIHVHEHGDQTLEEMGFDCGEHERNNLIIGDKNSTPPKRIEVSDSLSGITFDSEGFASNMESIKGKLTLDRGDSSCTYVPPPAPPPYTSGSTEYSYSYSNALTRQDTGFVGLVNQAMTCYLNSLLQTLFMTPEFRNALYRWEFDGSEDEGSKSIPFQLQKLFLQLQTSKKPAVGTTELTTSFGWDSSEAWQQHDVQELCRVMFDALEQKFKNTEQSDLISTLYEGKLKDYVKCLECGYESAREDTFLDVPLVVRPFGSSQSYGSVGEALQAFVTPEILQGSNQYFCEQCNKKCDAHKGLKFIKFPYLLTLQLKRFDFDPNTMHRIKLNDRVSFPEILNLNEFIKTGANLELVDDGDTTDSGSALDDEGACFASGCKTGCSLSPEACSDNDLPDDDEGIDVSPHASSIENNHELCTNERNLKKCMEKGPYVYELFSIMVHSGSANGGHYYAYIKSFKRGEWYCFNDAQVSKITYDDIQKTYGGGPSRGYYSSAYSSSTNAYMLMYRQIDKEKNTECMCPDEFPEHIKTLLQSMQEQEEQERIARELDRSMCKIKLFCQHPKHHRMIEMKLKVHKNDTLAEATETAHTILGLEGLVPLNCCRLVKYDEFCDSLESSFEASSDERMGDLLGGVKSSYKFDLLLEIKKPEEKFEEYKPGGTTVKVHVVDLEREEVAAHPLTIRSHPNNSVDELRSQIAAALGVDGIMRIVLDAFSNEFKLLNVPTRTLSNEGFRKSNKVFVEFKDSADAQLPYNESKLFQVLDCYAHTICINVSLPKVDEAILNRLRIHDCEADEDKYDSSSEDGDENVDADAVNADKSADDNTSSKTNSVLEGERTENSKFSSINQYHSKKSLTSVTPDDSSQDYDEGLGDSEIGDSSSTNGYQTTQAVHSDQSEDSSLTDSERTLVGDELSPRNNSPDIMGIEIEQDQEPANHSVFISASGTPMKSYECGCVLMNVEEKCPLHEGWKPMTSWSYESNKNSKSDENCKNVCPSSNQPPVSEVIVKRHFRAWPYTDFVTKEKMLRVFVDKRITLAEVKKELEPHLGVGADCFKIYRVYTNNQEFECVKLFENLMSYGDDNADAVNADKSADDNTSSKTNSVLEGERTENSKFSSINQYHSKKSLTSVTPDDSSQDYDEGLGDSEIGDSSSTNGYQTTQAVHSDQSEDSSLTDSERTLVGDELSPRNNSPDIMGIEIEQDQEPANHSVFISASGTPMKSYECGCVLMNVEEKCPLHEGWKPMTSWSYESNKSSKSDENCKNVCPSSNQPPVSEVIVKRHFRAWPYTDFVTKEKMLRVFVDKRITLAEVKKELEPHLGVGADCFKIYRVYTNNQEFECVKLFENLMSYGDDSRLTVKLGRALRKGEYKVKIYRLCVNDPEPFKYLIDWVLIKGMTILKAKKEILPEIKERCDLDVPLNRCRLRKKNWKYPGTIYLDSQRIEKDIRAATNWEMFLEILPDAEPVTSPDQLALFTRMWHPATYQLDKFQEIVLDDAKVETLKHKLSEISNVPEEFIEFAKGEGTFPCEVSLLTIHKELSWQTQASSLNTWPLCVGEDGHVIFYRDKREELKNLSEEEKREISNKENARSNKSLRNNYSPRKEKALKIYTLDSAPNNCSSTTNRSEQSQHSASSTATVSLFDPDLD